MKLYLLSVLSLLFSLQGVYALSHHKPCGNHGGNYVPVSLLDHRIYIAGCNYVHRTPARITFDRFPEEILNLPGNDLAFNTSKARTTTGVTIRFFTASPTVKLRFTDLGGINRGHDFAVFQDDSLTNVFRFSAEDDSTIVLDIGSYDPGRIICFRVTMPNWSRTSLSLLAVEEGFQLEEYSVVTAKILVTCGNSITHGTGQRGTHMTYPFILSERLGTELYNFAVGGSKVSVPVAELLSRDIPKIDVLVLLIGYNDFYGSGQNVEQFLGNYKKFLDAFRKVHNRAHVFCITPTAVKDGVSPVSGLCIDDFREAIEELVKERSISDSLIHLIAGEGISDITMLRDNVHFSEEGAERFATALAGIIAPYLKQESE